MFNKLVAVLISSAIFSILGLFFQFRFLPLQEL